MPQRNNLSTFRWSSYKFKTEIGTLEDNCNVAWRLFFDRVMIRLVKNLSDSHTLTARMRVSYWSFITRTHQGTWGSQWQRLGATIPAAGNRVHIRQTAANVQVPLQLKHANRNSLPSAWQLTWSKRTVVEGLKRTDICSIKIQRKASLFICAFNDYFRNKHYTQMTNTDS